ncbi:AAA family ATPase [Vreelandella piezotolerans]|uniref:AAA family ATPase n=1 Tax=Vreelandella piezotolerans TaxID=2609667 RepID=A0ABQ6X8V4_9GAMM|nr:AAA family ATPase [Halomonas piezotolerans]KAE8438444.1 AAA family ATPase [Halomonas piezotolerans]QJA22871.1 AAA family ATPase [Halomonas piezotolerans]
MTSARLYSLVQVAKQRKGSDCYVNVINTDGSIKKRHRSLIVRFPHHYGEIPTGSLWKVTGQQAIHQFMVNGFLIYEDVLEANHALLVRPTTHTLSRWIRIRVEGIGEVIANRLVRQRNLEKWVRSADVDKLCTVHGMNATLAQRLIEQWPAEGLYRTMDWLNALDLSPSLGFKLTNLFGDDAIARLTANPFLLLGLNVSYSKVLTVIDQLQLNLPDEVLIAGAAMHAFVERTSSSGSTVVSGQVLRESVNKTLRSLINIDPGLAAVKKGLLVRVQDGYQSWGMALMEAEVARKLVLALRRPGGHDSLHAAWENQVDRSTLHNALALFEHKLPFTLSEEQRQAVIGVFLAPVVGISGGAGTGKTTILKAIIGLYEALSDKWLCLPVALSGRAARRMEQRIGKPAQTIAKLISDHQGKGKPSLPDQLLIIIDEASMVDLLSMYRLVDILPEASRFILLGDIAKLPPIGSGLVFHMLYKSPIPFFELTQVKRQLDQSLVHRFATAVREGEPIMPELCAETLSTSSDCCILSPPSLNRLTEFWRDAGKLNDRIILSPRRSGNWGVTALNDHFQSVQGAERADLHYLDPAKGWVPWVTLYNQRLKQGDLIMVTEDIYDDSLDVRDGDLGVITEVYPTISSEGWYGVAEINGEMKGINQTLLEVLDLSYSITVHEAQGTQWHTVFSVVTREAQQMLDASLIYTASTRPTDCLVIVADLDCLQDAVKAGNSANWRQVDIGKKLAKLSQTR